ncbi:MAG: hypothetical protein ABSH12_02455 [Endomicrobiales bacterium]|jgi:hypothetical protein
MKKTGKRTEPSIDFHASADKLRIGALFNDETQRMMGSRSALIPKGVYHFKTHKQANDHWETHCIKEVVRRNTK